MQIKGRKNKLKISMYYPQNILNNVNLILHSTLQTTEDLKEMEPQEDVETGETIRPRTVTINEAKDSPASQDPSPGRPKSFQVVNIDKMHCQGFLTSN